MVSHLRTPIYSCFTYVFGCYFLTYSEFSCLAMLASSYPVSGSTYLPQIPNQLHCMSKSAQEVLGTILQARLMPAFTIQSIFLCISAWRFVFKPALFSRSPSLLLMF